MAISAYLLYSFLLELSTATLALNPGRMNLFINACRQCLIRAMPRARGRCVCIRMVCVYVDLYKSYIRGLHRVLAHQIVRTRMLGRALRLKCTEIIIFPCVRNCITIGIYVHVSPCVCSHVHLLPYKLCCYMFVLA